MSNMKIESVFEKLVCVDDCILNIISPFFRWSGDSRRSRSVIWNADSSAGLPRCRTWDRDFWGFYPADSERDESGNDDDDDSRVTSSSNYQRSCTDKVPTSIGTATAALPLQVRGLGRAVRFKGASGGSANTVAAVAIVATTVTSSQTVLNRPVLQPGGTPLSLHALLAPAPVPALPVTGQVVASHAGTAAVARPVARHTSSPVGHRELATSAAVPKTWGTGRYTHIDGYRARQRNSYWVIKPVTCKALGLWARVRDIYGGIRKEERKM
ncbi:hypothetical protein FIBSPDRAFT_882850 [Athelia psychrophila]|uniref:Uncharacterized protein n=1 Tax=Athelia psychrophila TaxID=1759441 RepID=A0A166USJ5_9AGAM|nr:hypothetical protein FIBSPDRAFT_882850 [Fibularhizoctonia sp. CBS 109695]